MLCTPEQDESALSVGILRCCPRRKGGRLQPPCMLSKPKRILINLYKKVSNSDPNHQLKDELSRDPSYQQLSYWLLKGGSLGCLLTKDNPGIINPNLYIRGVSLVLAGIHHFWRLPPHSFMGSFIRGQHSTEKWNHWVLFMATSKNRRSARDLRHRLQSQQIYSPEAREVRKT